MPHFRGGALVFSAERLAGQLSNAVIGRLLRFTGSQQSLSIQLDITNACNLSCVHCYHSDHSNAGALDFEGWNHVLDQYGALLRKLHLGPRFVLCGGEPTISPLFLPMLKELDSRWPDARITVLTNATRLSPGFIKKLGDHNLGFQISLDGPDEARHDMIRGAGSFSQSMAGLRSLQSAARNAFFLSTLSLRTSAWIAEFFDTAAKAGVEAMGFTRFISQGQGRELEQAGQDRALAPLELRDAYSAILAHSSRTGVRTATDLPLFHLLDKSLGAHGKVGFQGLVVDYKGRLKVTSRTEFVLGNVLEDGLEHLFLSHPVMRGLRERKIAGCGGCEHFEHCGGDRGASFAATGSFLEKDPGCWINEVHGGSQ